MNDQRAASRAYPRLPVLGWSAFSGERDAPVPGVLNARYRRHTISGRAAIALALQVVGARPGEKVLVPTYHCTTMIAPVVQADLQPVFYPVTARGGANLDWLQRADMAGVRVMLATHYFGLPQPMRAIREICDARGIALIEDCAHAFFGSSDGRPVGSWGNVAIASLTKFFPVPEGGLIASMTSQLDELELTGRSWRDEIKAAADAVEVGAMHGNFHGLNSLLGGIFAMKHWLRGSPRISAGAAPAGVNGADDSAMHRVQQRLLSSAKPAYAARWIADGVHQQRIVERRRRNYLELARRLAGMAGARVLQAELPGDAVPYVFPLYVNNPAASYHELRATGIPIFRWDEVWPGTPVIEGDHGLAWSTGVFQLGCHQDLSPDDLEAIAATVRETVRT